MNPQTYTSSFWIFQLFLSKQNSHCTGQFKFGFAGFLCDPWYCHGHVCTQVMLKSQSRVDFNYELVDLWPQAIGFMKCSENTAVLSKI